MRWCKKRESISTAEKTVASGKAKANRAIVVPLINPNPSYSDWFMNGQLTYDPNTHTARVFLVCTSSENVPMAQALGIIPEPYRPSEAKTVYCNLRMNNNAQLLTYIGVVETNGNIRQLGTNAMLNCLVVGEYLLD